MGVCASKGLLRRRRRRRKFRDINSDVDLGSLYDLRAEEAPDGLSESPYVLPVVALFDFSQQTHGDLTFVAGDRMVVTEEEWISDANWMTAFNLRTRQHGVIPKNYVRELREPSLYRPLPSLSSTEDRGILSRLREHVQHGSAPQVVHVRREDPVTDFLHYLALPQFHLRQRIYVTFHGEEGVDQGGLTRDLASAILRHLRHSPVLEGPAGRMCLSHSLGALSRQEYLRAGQLLAFVLCHAALPCPLFGDGLVRLLCGGLDERLVRDPRQPVKESPRAWAVDVEEVPDAEFRERLQEIESSDFPCPVAEEVAEEIGYFDPLKADQKGSFLLAACQYYLCHRCRSEIEQFKAGLQQLGVLDVLRRHPEEAENVLCGSQAVAMTADDVFQLFVVVWDGAHGTVERQEEEVTCFEFQFFLQECASGDCQYSLSDVVSFLTGATTIPPGGFEQRPTLRFARVPYPRVSTCTLELTLPLSLPPDKTLRDVMVLALSSPEFGVA